MSPVTPSVHFGPLFLHQMAYIRDAAHAVRWNCPPWAFWQRVVSFQTLAYKMSTAKLQLQGKCCAKTNASPSFKNSSLGVEGFFEWGVFHLRNVPAWPKYRSMEQKCSVLSLKMLISSAKASEMGSFLRWMTPEWFFSFIRSAQSAASSPWVLLKRTVNGRFSQACWRDELPRNVWILLTAIIPPHLRRRKKKNLL